MHLSRLCPLMILLATIIQGKHLTRTESFHLLEIMQRVTVPLKSDNLLSVRCLDYSLLEITMQWIALISCLQIDFQVNQQVIKLWAWIIILEVLAAATQEGIWVVLLPLGEAETYTIISTTENHLFILSKWNASSKTISALRSSQWCSQPQSSRSRKEISTKD